jgi:hypothetical protein
MDRRKTACWQTRTMGILSWGRDEEPEEVGGLLLDGGPSQAGSLRPPPSPFV